MPKIAPLDLKLAPDAKARMLTFISSITEYEATLCLMKGRTNDEPDERWSYGSYGPENIASVGPELERRGHALLYSVEDLVIAIPQFNFVPELAGKTLGLGNRDLVVLHRAPGI